MKSCQHSFCCAIEIPSPFAVGEYFLICNKFFVAKTTGFRRQQQQRQQRCGCGRHNSWYLLLRFLGDFGRAYSQAITPIPVCLNLPSKIAFARIHREWKISITEHYSISFSYQYNVFLFQWVFFSIVCPGCSHRSGFLRSPSTLVILFVSRFQDVRRRNHCENWTDERKLKQCKPEARIKKASKW